MGLSRSVPGSPSNVMSKSASVTPPSFEASLAELESIVQSMEEGQLSLEQALNAYQRGAELLKICQTALSAAEQRVAVLENGLLKELPGEGNGRT